MTTVHDRYGEDDIRGFYDSGFWRAESLYDLVARQASAYGEKVFLYDSTQSYTYAELHEQSLRLAVGLRRLGIGRGDRVVVQLPNWAEFGLIAVALNRAGAVLVPVMPIYRDEEVRYLLQHSGATAAITAEEFNRFRYVDMYDGLRADCPDLATVVAVRGSAGPDRAIAALQDIAADGSEAELAHELGADASPDDSFLVVYTSGTTARPKGCHHTLNTVRASAYAIAKSLDYTERDVQFGPSPVTHATGLITSLLLPLISGASSHLMETWEPAEGINRVSRHACTVTVTATAFLQMMMGAFDPGRHDVSSMRLWICAGSPIPGAVVERARTMLSGGRVLSLYGRSENFLTTMCTVDDPPERSVTSDGSALEGAQVSIVDPSSGKEVPRGEEGDIAYRGPSHMLEYYREPEQTQQLFTAEGYSRSGDLGRMDADGFVRVTGRLKDIVIRGGLNISAREIEDLLLVHDAIAAVAVVGFPDDRLGERVCAYVVTAAGQEAPTIELLATFLREKKVATPKLPERVEIVDALPMTATGKVQKHLLREDVAKKLLR